jgi:CRP/FNR family transcriptional regulator, cyclic AMP receptor protein
MAAQGRINMATTTTARLSAPGFLRLAGRGKTPLQFQKGEVIFAEGDRKEAIFYLERGSVKLTVTSRHGREAIIGILVGGDFLGEGAVTGEGTIHAHGAVAMSDSRVLRIERDLMMNILTGENLAALFFIRCLLRRSAETQIALADTLLYSSEKRLARTLLSIIDKGSRTPKVNQQMLAEMIGITRQRVNFLMQNMKKQGLVDFAHGGRGHNFLRRIARNNEI